MKEQGIYTEKLPEYPHSLLIAGFDGWGNALDVSKSMVSYLIRKLKAKKFAWINPELFYRYDENRPVVKVAEGRLREISPPGVSFFSARNGPEKEGIVILKGSEPNLRWFQFVDEVLSFCKELKIRKIINVGSMYDDVLHSDRIISGLASDDDLVSHLKQKDILPITYSGPGGIHSTLHAEAQKRGFKCISLWCHFLGILSLTCQSLNQAGKRWTGKSKPSLTRIPNFMQWSADSEKQRSAGPGQTWKAQVKNPERSFNSGTFWGQSNLLFNFPHK